MHIFVVLAIGFYASILRAGDSGSRVLADFESSASTLSGPITIDNLNPKSGLASGKLTAAFEPGAKNQSASATTSFAYKQKLRTVSFFVRSIDVESAMVRLVDSQGQHFQQKVNFKNNGEWHPIVIESFNGKGVQSWGGPNDKQIRWPVVSLSILLDSAIVGPRASASIWIDDLSAKFDPDLILRPLASDPQQLGNIFNTDEKPLLRFETAGDRITWTVTDFWRNTISKGETSAKDGYAFIDPKVVDKGYFELSATAYKGSERLTDAQTSFAIIAPADLSKMQDSPFGVMTHFAQNWETDILSLVAKAGIKLIRDEHYWNQVEKEKGVYQFREHSNRYMTEAKRLGIDPIIVMSFENNLYDLGNTPYTPEGYLAFAKYGEAILQQYPEIKRIEVWNEYNGTWCKGPAAKDRPKSYAAMVKGVYEYLKPRFPNVQILGGAAVLLPPPYFEGIFKNGGMPYMDGIVIHPYRGRPEGIDTEVAALQEMIRRYNNGKDKPIVVTETGTHDKSANGRDNVAKYLIKQYTLLLSQNAQPICWYLLRDYNDFATMGLLRDVRDPMGRYVPAPAYVAYANLIQQLYGATFEAREITNRHTYIERFKKDSEQVLVLWSTVPATVTFQSAGEVKLIDMMGAERILYPTDGEIHLSLSDTPIFLRGSKLKLVESGSLIFPPEQSVDLLESPTLILSSPKGGGEIEIAGKRYPFPVTGKIALINVGTNQPAQKTLRYSLAVNDRLTGAGEMTLNVIDPVKVSREPLLINPTTVELKLANHSRTTGYAIESVRVRIGAKVIEMTVASHLPAGQEMTLRVPIEAIAPYAIVPAELTVRMKDRPAIVANGNLFNCPVKRQTVQVDGERSEWAGIQENALETARGVREGSARFAWDDDSLYLCIDQSAEQFTVGIAPQNVRVESIRRSWYEFDVSGPKAAVQFAVADDLDSNPSDIRSARKGSVTELAIPWKKLGGRPASGTLRLSIAVKGADGYSDVQWGGGILRGKTPMAYRLVQLSENEATSSPRSSAVSASLEPLGTPPPLAAKVVTDSDVDYSNTQGQRDWTYGYMPGVAAAPYTDADFIQLQYQQTVWGYTWGSGENGLEHLKLNPTGGHPGVLNGRPVWAVRRWSATMEGRYRLTGNINCKDRKGDGIQGVILVDGVVVYTASVGGKRELASLNYDVTVNLNKNSIVGFCITPGETIDTSYDASGFTAKIERLQDDPKRFMTEAAKIVIRQPRVGNVFDTNDSISMPIESNLEEVHWTLSNGWGQIIRTGDSKLDGGKTEVSLLRLPQGYYVLTVHSNEVKASSSFVVFAPIDLSRIPDSPFGVMTHFAQKWETDLLESLARTGIKHVRDEVYWDSVEKEKGVFNFDAFKPYRDDLDKHHIVPLTPLSFGNQNYDAVPGVPIWAAAPYTAEGFKAYARYCAEVVKHYGPRVPSVEIWNEYNGGFAKGPADGKPEVYAEMLKHAYQAIKENRPDVKVLGCSTVGIPLSWIEGVFAAGGLNHMDGVSVHPYGYLFPPENQIKQLEDLRALIRKYNGGKEKPIWVTEQGWYLLEPGKQGNHEPITEMVKANYLVRNWVIFLSQNVEKSFWYLARNDPSFGTMGLMGKPDDPQGRYAPREALAAYGKLIRTLNGLNFTEREKTSEHIYSYSFAGPGKVVRIMWSTEPTKIAIEAGETIVSDLFGKEMTLSPVNGKIHLVLTESPLYVSGVTNPIQLDTRQDPDLWVTTEYSELLISDPIRWTPVVEERDGKIVSFGVKKTFIEPAVRFDRFPRVVDDSKLELHLLDHRTSQSDLEITKVEVGGNSLLSKLKVSGTRTISIAMPKFDLWTVYPVKVETSDSKVSLEATISRNPVTKRSIKIDGVLDEWNDLPAIDLGRCKYVKLLKSDWGGESDLSGSARLAYDESFLYFSAEVRDDHFDQSQTGWNVWKGDNFQFGISYQMPWESGVWKGAQEIGISLIKSGPEAFRFGGFGTSGVIRSVKLAIRREGEKTRYEFAIPWKEITPDGKAANIGFALYLNDADGDGRRGYLQWGNIKSTATLQMLQLQN